jgi:hypothetical protein
MTSTGFPANEERLDSRRRAMIFGFGALTTTAAIDAIKSTAMASEPFRQLLLAQLIAPNTDVRIWGAVVYKPLVTQLNTQFASTKSAKSMGAALRAKFGNDLSGYKFGGFVADPKDDGKNTWLPGSGAPQQFRQDRNRFPPAELDAFEQSMRANFGIMPGQTAALDWPINFWIAQGDVGDKKSHVLLVKDSTGASQWFCITVCYDA